MAKEIIKEVLNYLQNEISNLNDIKVNRVCIGLGYTGVKLETGHAGICHTLQTEMMLQGCPVMKSAGTLSTSSAIKLAHLAESWELNKRVVGVATMNALSQIVLERENTNYQVIEGNLLENIEIRKNDTVVLVGRIRPFIPVIKLKAKKVFILERNPMRAQGVLSENASKEIIPKADVIIITGSAIANGTVDYLLDLSIGAREVVFGGPTASLIPDPFFKRGVKVIGGIKVINAERLLDIIAEGGGTMQIKPTVKFLVMKQKNI